MNLKESNESCIGGLEGGRVRGNDIINTISENKYFKKAI